MVKSFLSSYENSNSIEGEKMMENFSSNNGNDDSSIFISRIREQELELIQNRLLSTHLDR
ncbi:hypothetical protein Wxf_00456 [Wolbachia endosymbiont of Armadillidium vulgare]|nr:hypothetical protein Wxf_00456 [Wolbachia endosymbiont of Armadillidium vulgare]